MKTPTNSLPPSNAAPSGAAFFFKIASVFVHRPRVRLGDDIRRRVCSGVVYGFRFFRTAGRLYRDTRDTASAGFRKAQALLFAPA